MLELPLTNDPAQIFITQLGDRKYSFDIKYNDLSGVWTADISDPLTNTLLLAGVALLPGQNLMDPYNTILDNLFAVRSDPLSVITPEDFGTKLKAYWLTPEEIENGG